MLDDLITGTVHGGNFMEDGTKNTKLASNRGDKKITKLLDPNEKELYEGCSKFTRLLFIIKLLHFNSISSLSNVHFDMLLDLLQAVIPKWRESIPKSLYGTAKLLKHLNLIMKRYMFVLTIVCYTVKKV